MKNYLFVCAIAISQVAFAQWTTVNSGTTADLNDVYFFDEDTGFVVGDGLTFRKTMNGGNSWSNVTIDNSVTGGTINKISFNQNKTIGIAIVELNNNSSVFLRTTDKGNNWTAIHQVAGKMKTVSFYDTDKILVAGELGEMYKSESAGLTWNIINTNIFSNISDISCATTQVCYTCTDAAAIHKTINAANSWNTSSSGTAIKYTSVFTISADSVFAVGYTASDSAYLVNTYNGGSAWFPPLYMGVEHLNDIYFSDRLTGYAVGGSPVIGSNSQYIAKTVDGGFTWQQQQEATQKELNAVFFIDALNGYAAGVNGTVIKTTNGGVTGIAEKNKVQNLALFPNPVNDFLQVQFGNNKPFSYRIVDVNGKEIAKGEMKNEDAKINCADLLPGNYVLLIQQEEKLLSGQFLKN
jgi:photosystem II stability/assembly factor-like uncharacterized protein